MRMPSERSDEQRLLDSLTRELFQTESSASRHCRREAARLPNSGPAAALRAIATHADAALASLPQLAARNGLPVSRAGMSLGVLFSEARHKLLDLPLTRERSYRMTLLGCRHGVDLVRVLHHLVERTGNAEIHQFCSAWLTTRQVLVQEAEEELVWFARQPGAALQRAHPLLPIKTSPRRAA